MGDEEDVVMNVCISVPVRIEHELFRMWLDGTTESVAVTRRIHSINQELVNGSTSGLSFAANYMRTMQPSRERLERMVKDDVREQYVAFEVLGHHFSNPHLLEVQTMFAFAANEVVLLLSEFFSLDREVLRNIVGRRPKKLLRSLNAIHEQTGRPLAVCRRQATNVVAIYRFASALEKGNVLEAIARNFRLPVHLASVYMKVIFLVHHRFDLHRLDTVRYEDLEGIAEVLIEHWCDVSAEGFARLAVDKQLLEALRDLRALLQSTRNTAERYFELIRLEWTSMPAKLGNAFRDALKVLLNIGSQLSKEHEFQDFMEDVAEQVMAPLKDSCDMNVNDMDMLFSCMSSTLGNLLDSTTGLKDQVREHYIVQWTRYLRGVKGCIWKLSGEDDST